MKRILLVVAVVMIALILMTGLVLAAQSVRVSTATCVAVHVVGPDEDAPSTYQIFVEYPDGSQVPVTVYFDRITGGTAHYDASLNLNGVGPFRVGGGDAENWVTVDGPCGEVPTPTASPTSTPTNIPTKTPMPSDTATDTPTPGASETPIPSVTVTIVPTSTPLPSETVVPTPTLEGPPQSSHPTGGEGRQGPTQAERFFAWVRAHWGWFVALMVVAAGAFVLDVWWPKPPKER